jgi:hypothetical protein
MQGRLLWRDVIMSHPNDHIHSRRDIFFQKITRSASLRAIVAVLTGR